MDKTSKIGTKIVVTRCVSKYAQNEFAAGLRPDPSGELTALPRPLAGFGGGFAAERRRGRKQRGREEKGPEGRKHKGRGG